MLGENLLFKIIHQNSISILAKIMRDARINVLNSNTLCPLGSKVYCSCGDEERPINVTDILSCRKSGDTEECHCSQDEKQITLKGEKFEKLIKETIMLEGVNAALTSETNPCGAGVSPQCTCKDGTAAANFNHFPSCPDWIEF